MSEEVIWPTNPAFCIFDRKANMYDFPMGAPNKAVAIRRFGDMMDQEGSVFVKHAADFDLYYSGEWDTQQGEFSKASREFVINGAIAQEKHNDA